MKKINPILMITLVIFTALGSFAKTQDQERQNTFVGNGGNAGDLELQLTVSQLKRITKRLVEDADSEDSGCQCPAAYVGRPLCEPIQALESHQSKFCAKILPDKAKELQNLLSAEGGVKFDWSEEHMTVIESDGAREAHAVANQETKRILINRSYFVKLTPPERVFLIAHELLHFTKLDGQYLRDDAPVKNFAGRDGGRQLINSLSSSVATYGAAKNEYAQEARIQRRSKNYVNNWFTLSGGSVSGEKTSTFATDNRESMALEYGRRLTDNLGVFVMGKISNSDDQIFSSTSVKSQQNGGALGLSYRIMPFDNPASFWGQSFLSLSLGAEFLRTTYELDDTFVKIKDEADSTAALLRAQYFLPVVKGLWGLAELSATNHKYEMEEINVVSRPVQAQIYLGVGYGF